MKAIRILQQMEDKLAKHSDDTLIGIKANDEKYVAIIVKDVFLSFFDVSKEEHDLLVELFPTPPDKDFYCSVFKVGKITSTIRKYYIDEALEAI